ncbi:MULTISPECIES: PLP-dependent transferase, partial [Brucella]
ILVDGGTFDWAKSGNYPLLTEPRPDYAGLELHKTFGNISFAIAARVLGLRDFGPAISPFNAFQILTGVETLALRMQRHSDNALKVATWLHGHEKVSWVNYAGLPHDKYHALQQKYAPKGAGSVFTFGIKGGYEAGVKFVDSLELFSLLANLGDTRSLVIHPASTTHRQLSDEQKVAAGAGPDVVRLSIGIEDADDIIADLEQA